MSFLPGLELSRRFHREVVAPALAAGFPRLRYAAARMDTGSELFGFDTPRSRDHDWGPRVQIFLDTADRAMAVRVLECVDRALPPTFLGCPTRFAPDAYRSLGVPAPDGARHGVTVAELGTWCRQRLGFDPRHGVGRLDWLATPTQRLAEFTGGDVFHDDLPRPAATAGGVLRMVRDRLAWYPDDVWRYVLAAQWSRIGGEEPLVGRCGEVGDEIGGAVVTARLVRDLMRLALLLHRRYPPYGKWLGTAFGRLPQVAPLRAALAAAATATGWRQRQHQLCQAYESLAAQTNRTGLAEPAEPSVRPFFDRPFLVLDAGRFAAVLRGAITDPAIGRLPPVGAVDQVFDHTGLLTDVVRTRAAVAAALAISPTPAVPNER
ncbi:DUF4037 domain-containing protein [Solwaraspora sp. WMMB335]|uniref:DUF4037 domain-containing protein n=1 Tax=Solwaraspora sp. WMMB335 TaxID=3404118 RepID=UPI003B927FFC